MERMMERLTIADKTHPGRTKLLLKFETQTSEEILPRSGREILEIKENRGGPISRSDHPSRRITLMMGRR
jgi:hypothetical protein